MDFHLAFFLELPPTPSTTKVSSLIQLRTSRGKMPPCFSFQDSVSFIHMQVIISCHVLGILANWIAVWFMKVGSVRWTMDEMDVVLPRYKLSPSRSLSPRRHQPNIFLFLRIDSSEHEHFVIHMSASPFY